MDSTYHIIEFKVTVDDGVAIARQVVADKVDDRVVFFVCSSKSLTSLNVLDRSLLGFNPLPGVAMARVEAGLFAVSLQADGVRVDAVEPGERFDEREPTGKKERTCQQWEIHFVMAATSGELTPCFYRTAIDLQDQGR